MRRRVRFGGFIETTLTEAAWRPAEPLVRSAWAAIMAFSLDDASKWFRSGWRADLRDDVFYFGEFTRLVEKRVRTRRDANPAVLLRRMVGEHDERRFAHLGVQCAQHVQRGALGKLKVEHDYIRAAFGDRCDGGGGVFGAARDRDGRQTFEKVDQRVADIRRILDDED